MFPDARDLLIFSLRTGNMAQSFSVGDLTVYPDYDLRKYLDGYDPDDIEFIIDSEAKYAQYRPRAISQLHLFSPIVEDNCLIPFRLFKPGWLSAMTIMPVTRSRGIEIRSELGSLKQIFGQILAEPMHYDICENDLQPIQAIHQNLVGIPKGFLDLALRRFSRSYEYYFHSEYAGVSELDDYVVDLVIALESITCRRGERIRQTIAKRTVLLLGTELNQAERDDLKQKVRKFYDHRCKIVHGEHRNETPQADYEERFNTADDLRDLVRDSLNACIRLLNKPGLALYKSPGKRKAMAEIIDSGCEI